MNDIAEKLNEVLATSQAKQDERSELISQLMGNLLYAAIIQDNKLKELDKSIDPSSYGLVVHLVLTLKELLNDKS